MGWAVTHGKWNRAIDGLAKRANSGLRGSEGGGGKEAPRGEVGGWWTGGALRLFEARVEGRRGKSESGELEGLEEERHLEAGLARVLPLRHLSLCRSLGIFLLGECRRGGDKSSETGGGGGDRPGEIF